MNTVEVWTWENNVLPQRPGVSRRGHTSALPFEKQTCRAMWVHPDGLHARPAARVARIANTLDSEAIVRCGTRQASARSILELLSLGVQEGDIIAIELEGRDAQDGMQELLRILQDSKTIAKV